MDDSQPPGDIAHTSALNDRKLLALLSNYLYRFVSVHLLAVFGQAVSSPLWQKYSTEMQPCNSYRRAVLRVFSGKHQKCPFLWYKQLFEEIIGRKGRRKDWGTKGYRGLVNRKGQWLNIKSWFDKIIKHSSFSCNFCFIISHLGCYVLWMLQRTFKSRKSHHEINLTFLKLSEPSQQHNMKGFGFFWSIFNVQKRECVVCIWTTGRGFLW